MTQFTLHSVVIAGLLGLVGCDRLWPRDAAQSQPPQGAPRVPAVLGPDDLAVVNGTPITRQDYTRHLAKIPEERKPKSPEEKKRFLEDLIRVELLAQDALAMRLEEREEQVKQAIQDFRRQFLINEWGKRTLESVTVDPQEIEQYYEQYKAAFTEPERIRLRQIVVKTEEEAKAILVQLLEGADVSQVARARSVGPKAESGGEIGWVIREADRQLSQLRNEPLEGTVLFAQLEQVAFALEVGGISGVVKGPDGYHLVKLEERAPGRQKPQTEVWDQIKSGLLTLKQQQRLEERVAELRTNATVEIREERLADL